jgi:hypothetical protein
MSFYDTQTYCGIVDMTVVVVSICNEINFAKVWMLQQSAAISLLKFLGYPFGACKMQ